MGITLLSEVLGTQLDQGRVVHPLPRCSRTASHAETSASPCVGAGFLLLLLEHVTQRALARTHRVVQWGTEETVCRPGAVTRNELREEKAKREETRDKSQNVGEKD